MPDKTKSIREAIGLLSLSVGLGTDLLDILPVAVLHAQRRYEDGELDRVTLLAEELAKLAESKVKLKSVS